MVVGTVKIRDADPTWPAVGSKLHHAVGAWPLLLEDDSQVLECEPPKRLVLQARGWPAGEARVQLVLHAEGDVTRVAMDEHPTHGPGAWLHNPLLDGVLTRRLSECLDRLPSRPGAGRVGRSRFPEDYIFAVADLLVARLAAVFFAGCCSSASTKVAPAAVPHRLDAGHRRAAGLIVLRGGDGLAVGGEQVPVELLAGPSSR
jgi:hypothetical protein